ncbi:MAG: hypothetical protein EB023_12175 [Flavobacteriia bacterium]|nr:hypothetical protein [Flavobacteriia bacterium]
MYRQISDFAPDIDNQYSADPLFYCTTDGLDSQFLHGAQGRIFGRYNKHCSEFLSTRCAKNWDDVCEAISHDRETRYPDLSGPLASYTGQKGGNVCLPYGEQLVRDSAIKKYKSMTLDCNLQCEPFDPTVANSPMICFETRTNCTVGSGIAQTCIGGSEGGICEPIYTITPEQARVLDTDPVMNRILNKPEIALDLLENIYKTLEKNKQLNIIQNTRLAKFYQYLGHPI